MGGAQAVRRLSHQGQIPRISSRKPAYGGRALKTATGLAAWHLVSSIKGRGGRRNWCRVAGRLASSEFFLELGIVEDAVRVLALQRAGHGQRGHRGVPARGVEQARQRSGTCLHMRCMLFEENASPTCAEFPTCTEPRQGAHLR